MENFFTHAEGTRLRVHGLFRVTAFSTCNRKLEKTSDLNLELSYFPQLGLLEGGCNSLKNVTKGLRDVKEGGISARKVGLL